MFVEVRSGLPKSLYLLFRRLEVDGDFRLPSLLKSRIDLFNNRTPAHGYLFHLPGLLFCDSIQVILKVDEGKQHRHHQIESKADRLAPVVMIEKLFANLEDYDDPQEPGK